MDNDAPLKVKDLIKLLQELDPELDVVREYDSSFENILVQQVKLYPRVDDEWNPYSEWQHYSQPELKDVIVIHSNRFPLHVNLQPYKEPDPNAKRLDSQIVALEFESILPKIKDAFERDNLFYKRIK